MATALSFVSPNPTKTHKPSVPSHSSSSSFSIPSPKSLFLRTHVFPSSFPLGPKERNNTLLCNCSTIPFVSTSATHYEFTDDSSEVELRLELGKERLSPAQIYVDSNDNSLVIKVQKLGHLKTLLDTSSLYGMIKPSETIWYMDDNQLVVNLKKQNPELKWPDIMESWESLTSGLIQLLKGTSVFLVGESTEINHKIARELAVGLGYTPLSTKELLEPYTKLTIDSWVREEGSDAVAEAECAILESLSSQARTVVATLGGKYGAASRPNKWQHLFSGFTVWLSLSEAKDEGSMKEEVNKEIEDCVQVYSNAEVIVKLAGWDPTYSKTVAQASLRALKRLVLSDKDLTGRKSLYVRLGCRGDWPDIKPPGSGPSFWTGAPTPH
ncbi:putative inactive shikimate kinase like 2, chloroplastic [Castilleja foliolosa]|uniref:Inactive shikimate kinase like 2, chloroplastic n=1 Tax=Castilleja foliolosa TaxID=1961234 RepID=A0ABD3ESX4_9LAMI